MTTEEVKTMEIEETIHNVVSDMVKHLIVEVTSTQRRKFLGWVQDELSDKGIEVKFGRDSHIVMDEFDGEELIGKLVEYTKGRILLE